MTDEYKGMFSKITLEEASRVSKEYDRKVRALMKKGADVQGTRKIDLEYRKAWKEAIDYSSQFSREEIYALIGYGMVCVLEEDIGPACCGLEGKVAEKKEKKRKP